MIAETMGLLRCQDKTTGTADPRAMADCAAVWDTSARITIDLSLWPIRFLEDLFSSQDPRMGRRRCPVVRLGDRFSNLGPGRFCALLYLPQRRRPSRQMKRPSHVRWLDATR